MLRCGSDFPQDRKRITESRGTASPGSLYKDLYPLLVLIITDGRSMATRSTRRYSWFVAPRFPPRAAAIPVTSPL